MSLRSAIIHTQIRALINATLLAGRGHGDDWHLQLCYFERRGDPSCACIQECADARDALQKLGELP